MVTIFFGSNFTVDKLFQMSFTLSAVITAYDALGTLVSATASAYTTLTGYGARPVLPVQITASTDQTNVTTAQATWDTNVATAQAAYNTAIAAQRVGELAVTALILGGEWYKMTGLANWTTATQNIGIRDSRGAGNSDNTDCKTCLYLVSTRTATPAANFPNII